MKIVRVRRVGNSNMVVIPREFEGFEPGTAVVMEQVDGGIRITPVDVKDMIQRVGADMIEKHRVALEILAEHDRSRETVGA